MIADGVRRLGALVVALTLLLGPVIHASAMADMSVKMEVAGASNMPMPEGCDDCGGNFGPMAATACFANCTMPGAILISAPILSDFAVRVPSAVVKSAATDRYPSPDPYPPRPIVAG